MWFDGEDVSGDKSKAPDGFSITRWWDKSGRNRHMENVLGDPVVKHDGFEGRAVVDFDGNDRMNTSYDLRGASEASCGD